MTLDPLPQIRQEFKRLGWSEKDQQVFIRGVFKTVDNPGLLFLEEREKLLRMLKSLKHSH